MTLFVFSQMLCVPSPKLAGGAVQRVRRFFFPLQLGNRTPMLVSVEVSHEPRSIFRDCAAKVATPHVLRIAGVYDRGVVLEDILPTLSPKFFVSPPMRLVVV